MSDEITIDDLKKVIARIKPEAVKLNGVHGTLCKLEKFFVEADIQRIKCYIRDEKKILAWDALLDVLKCSDGEAFEEYVNHILSNSPTFPRSFQQALIDACCECRIGWLCKDLAASASSTNSQHQLSDGWETELRNRRRSKTGSVTSESSRDWSFDSNDPFFNDVNSTNNDNTASAKREFFRSRSKGSEHKSLTSSKGSMDDTKQLDATSCVSLLPERLRRKLGELLDLKTSLGKDWRRIAEEIEMNHNEVKTIEQSEKKTDAVLEEMGFQRMKIGYLVEILVKMCRRDCVEIIEHEIPNVTQSSDDHTRLRGKTEEVDNADQMQTCNIEQETSSPPEIAASISNKMHHLEGSHELVEASAENVNDRDVPISWAPSQQNTDGEANSLTELRPMRPTQEEDYECMMKSLNGDKNDQLSKARGLEEYYSPPTEELQSISFEDNISSLSLKDIPEEHAGSDPSTEDNSLSLSSSSSTIKLESEMVHQETADDSLKESKKGIKNKLALERSKDVESEVRAQIKKGGDTVPESSKLGKTGPEMAHPMQDTHDISSIYKESPTKYLHVTLPMIPTKDSTTMKVDNSINGDDSISSKGAGKVTECHSAGLIQDGRNSLPATPGSPKSNKTWTESDIFRKEFEVHDNLSDSLPCDLNAPSVESKATSSISSTVNWFMSNMLEKVGLGRRPVIRHVTVIPSKDAFPTLLQRSGMGRQLSTNNAVPSEHNEFCKEEIGSVSLKDAKVNSLPDSVCHGSKQTTEKKSSGFEGDSRSDGSVALVINNWDYDSLSKLPVKNFTDNLGKELEQCGWKVDVQTNLSKQGLKNTTERFAEKAKNKFALLYYFGHSVQIHEENYILPVDIGSHAKARLTRCAVSLDFILSKMAIAKASVIIVDAGRMLPGVTEKQWFPVVKDRQQHQCVLFTSSNFSEERFMAKLLGKRLQENETITSVKDWIAPFKNDFETFACSRRLLPLPLKVPSEGWNKKLLDYSNDKVERIAFFSKANGDLVTEKLKGKWLVNVNTDGSDLESDLNIFLKTVDDEDLACYLFYYEGPLEMENGELLLKQDGLKDGDESPTLSLVLELLSEIVLGPRIIILNATASNFDAKDLSADQYDVQETLLMISPPHIESNKNFYDELIVTLEQENVDLEDELSILSNNFDFTVFKSRLFNI